MPRKAIISPDTSAEIRGNLTRLGIEPVILPRTGLVQQQISGHHDIQLFACDNRVFCHPDISPAFLHEIEDVVEIVLCTSRLSREHPHDKYFNLACTGTFAFHRILYTDHVIKSFLELKGITHVNVRQGYAKCSTMIVDDRSIVTADASIHRTATTHGLDSLLIRPGGIDLPGYDYGFIGGATGLYDNTILCSGDLSGNNDYDAILMFLQEHGKKFMALSRERAVDLGSIIIL